MLIHVLRAQPHILSSRGEQPARAAGRVRSRGTLCFVCGVWHAGVGICAITKERKVPRLAAISLPHLRFARDDRVVAVRGRCGVRPLLVVPASVRLLILYYLRDYTFCHTERSSRPAIAGRGNRWLFCASFKVLMLYYVRSHTFCHPERSSPPAQRGGCGVEGPCVLLAAFEVRALEFVLSPKKRKVPRLGEISLRSSLLRSG